MKKWSKPTRPYIWAKFKLPIYGMLAVSIIAQLFSFYTEFYAIYNPSEASTIYKAAALSLLIEISNRVLIVAAIVNLFDFLRIRFAPPATIDGTVPNGMIDLVLFFFFGGLAVAVIGFSIKSSKDGAFNKVQEMQQVHKPVAAKVDSTQHTIKVQMIDAKYRGDSLKAVAKIDSIYAAKSSTLSANKATASALLSNYKNAHDYTPDSKWYTNRINAQYAALKTTKKSMRNLSKEKKAELQTALDRVRSNRQLSMAGTAAALYTHHTKADSTTAATTAAWAAKTERKHSFWEYLVYISVLSVLIAAFLQQLGYLLSGRQPIIIDNPVDFATSPLSKLKEGMKVHFYKGLDATVSIFVPAKMTFTESQIIVNQAIDNNTDRKKEDITDTEILDSEMVAGSAAPIQKIGLSATPAAVQAQLDRMTAENNVLKEQMQRIRAAQQQTINNSASVTPQKTTTSAPTLPAPVAVVGRQLKDSNTTTNTHIVHSNTVTTEKHLFNYNKHLDLLHKYWKRSYTSSKEKTKVENRVRAVGEVLIFAFNGFGTALSVTEEYKKMTVESGEGRGKIAYGAISPKLSALCERVLLNYHNSDYLSVKDYLDSKNLSIVYKTATEYYTK